jgi:hypothetical protein
MASSICAVRNLSSASLELPILPSTGSPIVSCLGQVQRGLRRRYSTQESSIQGTSDKGEAGVRDEAKRVEQVLEAPEHLNEKERAIWEMLMRDLECTSLEVCLGQNS